MMEKREETLEQAVHPRPINGAVKYGCLFRVIREENQVVRLEDRLDSSSGHWIAQSHFYCRRFSYGSEDTQFHQETHS